MVSDHSPRGASSTVHDSRPGDDAALEAVAAGASADATPISDLRANEDYRRAMIGVIAKRAVSVAVRRARGEEFPIPATPVFMEGSAR